MAVSRIKVYVLLASILYSSLSLGGLTYTVKPGDTLSEISQDHLPGKIYGPNGSLARLLDLNPQIKNPNLIYPNDQILINNNVELANSVQEDKVLLKQAATTKASTNQTEIVLEDNSKSQWSFDGSALLSLSYLTTTEPNDVKQATLVSPFTYLAQLETTYHWSEKFVSSLNIQLQKASYKKVGTAEVTNDSSTYFGAHLGSHYLRGNNRYGALLGIKQRPFATEIADEIFKIGNEWIGNLALNTNLLISESDSLLIYLNLQAGLLLPGSDIDAGYEVASRIDITNGDLSVFPYFNWNQQNTKSTDQDVLEIGVGLKHLF
ncbi:MAG: LysM peptidoglycan-binding domain-containing protein [Bacteriovoracaceae bacterium]|nr:LysM peptidoglycan-binding domain-containing protein [Bacteriovoracaceae bacterium]